jgi:hypothetical protein
LRTFLVTGGCGSGRTTALRHRNAITGTAPASIDVERSATTSERFLRAVVLGSPFAAPGWTLSRPPSRRIPTGR